MSWRFTLAMVRRESRSTLRRLLLYAASVAVGVAALVAIGSLGSSFDASVRDQSRTLLGGDMQLSSRVAFGPEVEPVLTSLEQSSGAPSRVTRFTSMALSRASRGARLVWVQAVDDLYPLYGEVVTEPLGQWASFRSGPNVLVDPALLVQLATRVGDTLTIGAVDFVIAGIVTKAPGLAGMRDAIAPRVFMPARYLDETRLLRPGSLAQYSLYFKTSSGDPADLTEIVEQNEESLRKARVRAETAEEYADELSENLGRLSRFLGLVGLVALLLGGVGVASGVTVFVRERLESAAILRCLGASQREIFAIYLLQATALGGIGSMIGVATGLTIHALVPVLAREWLPVEVSLRIDPAMIVSGLALGLWVTLAFALLPLLEIRGASPLRALRRDLDPREVRRDPLRRGVWLALFSSTFAVCIWQSPFVLAGLWFFWGLVGGLTALSISAWLAMRVLRAYPLRPAPYWLRQGVANLFRPRNQTLAITLALGLGVFLIAALHVVQRNLLQQLDLGDRSELPNLAVFDIQLDQAREVNALIEAHGARVMEQTPIVSARIESAGGVKSVVLRDRDDDGEPQREGAGFGRRWAMRREYRVTYRAEPSDSERVVAGEWWSDGTPRPDGLYRVSLDQNLAADLRVNVGDRITWDVQGVRVQTEVANLRRVDWARFQTNFFAVFEPGALEQAPQNVVVLARLDDAAGRAVLQRDLVERFPNLALLDANQMLQTLDALLGRVALAIRFMSAFALVAGVLILIGAISTSRYQRARESVLIRTLGAPAAVIRRILGTEYLVLGLLAAGVGLGLACFASWALMRWLFELDTDFPALDLLAIGAGTVLLSTGIGLSYGRDATRRTPLAGLREIIGS